LAEEFSLVRRVNETRHLNDPLQQPVSGGFRFAAILSSPILPFGYLNFEFGICLVLGAWLLIIFLVPACPG